MGSKTRLKRGKASEGRAEKPKVGPSTEACLAILVLLSASFLVPTVQAADPSPSVTPNKTSVNTRPGVEGQFSITFTLKNTGGAATDYSHFTMSYSANLILDSSDQKLSYHWYQAGANTISYGCSDETKTAQYSMLEGRKAFSAGQTTTTTLTFHGTSEGSAWIKYRFSVAKADSWACTNFIRDPTSGSKDQQDFEAKQVSITLQESSNPPSCNRNSPTSYETSSTAGQTFTLEARCTDSDADLDYGDWRRGPSNDNHDFVATDSMSGSSSTESHSFTLDAGTHFVHFIPKDDAGNWGTAATWRITVTQPDGAEITSFNHATGAVTAGNQISSTIAVRNTGTTARTFWVGLTYWKPDNTPYDVTPKQTSSIGGGNTGSVSFTWTLPSNAPTGAYDAHTAVYNSYDSGSNQLNGPYDDQRDYDTFTVQPASTNQKPTCSRTNPSPYDVSVTAGQSVTFTGSCADADGNLDYADWNLNGQWQETDQMSGSSGTGSWTRTFAHGTYDVTMEPRDEAGEYGTTVAAWRVAATAVQPDGAEITSFNHATGTVSAGSQLTSTVTVKNLGSSTRSFWVGLTYWKPDNTPYDWPPQETTSVAAGSTKSVTFSWNLPSNAPSGAYDAHAAVYDAYNSNTNQLSVLFQEKRDYDTFSVQAVSTPHKPSCVRASPSQYDVAVTSGQQVTFSATCTDPEGNLAGGWWLVDDEKLAEESSSGSDTTESHSFTLQEGSHYIAYYAYDSDGAESFQVGWAVRVAAASASDKAAEVAEPKEAATQKAPVTYYLLLHGVCSSADLWLSPDQPGHDLWKQLNRDGRALTPSYHPNEIEEAGGPGAFASRLLGNYQRILGSTGSPNQLVVIGHSFGGLLARAMLASDASSDATQPRIGRVVTIDSPDLGIGLPARWALDVRSLFGCGDSDEWRNVFSDYLQRPQTWIDRLPDSGSVESSGFEVYRTTFAYCNPSRGNLQDAAIDWSTLDSPFATAGTAASGPCGLATPTSTQVRWKGAIVLAAVDQSQWGDAELFRGITQAFCGSETWPSRMVVAVGGSPETGVGFHSSGAAYFAREIGLLASHGYDALRPDEGAISCDLWNTTPIIVTVKDSGEVLVHDANGDGDDSLSKRVSVIAGARSTGLELTIDSPSHDGRVVVINADGQDLSVQSAEQLRVSVDGFMIPRAVDYEDVLDFSSPPTGFVGEYHGKFLAVIGAEGMQVLVAVPHFSQRVILITKDEGGAAASQPWPVGWIVDSFTTVAVLITFALLASLCMFQLLARRRSRGDDLNLLHASGAGLSSRLRAIRSNRLIADGEAEELHADTWPSNLFASFWDLVESDGEEKPLEPDPRASRP